jgi:glycosyltransferase involved in cell wall biosynthesis
VISSSNGERQSMRRLLALVPAPVGVTPGQRSSFELWGRVLDRMTIDFAEYVDAGEHDAVHAPGGILRKARILGAAYLRQIGRALSSGRYDGVMVYREAALVGPELIERIAARHGTPVLYHLDDPLHVSYRSPVNGYFAKLKFAGKVPRMLARADVVTVNSEPLEEYASKFNANVFRIPSLIDEREYYRLPLERPPTQVVVGWSGSASTAANLGEIATPLKELAKEPGVKLLAIGAERVDGFEAVPWRRDTEVADLRRFDVGVLPIPDRPWNHWKFFMKLAQYMGLGLPAVATPLGSTTHIIRHGENGFLARNDEEWLSNLRALAHDADLRHAIGENAADYAARTFTISANAATIRSAVGALWGGA